MTTGWWTQAPVVDVLPDKRVWWRRIKRTVRLVAALARVWWPLSVPALVLLVARPPLLLATAGMALVVAGELVVWRRAGVALLAGPRRSVEVVFRHRWSRSCSLAGVALAADGAWRFPRLVSVTVGGRWWRPGWATVVCDPLPQHDVGSWPVLGDRLARQLGFSMVTPVVIDSTRLELRLRRENLPAMVRVGDDVAVEAINEGPSTVTLGESSLGDRIVWNLDESGRTSLFLGGGTGGGKANVLRLILLWCWAQLLAGHRVRVLVFNPKGDGGFEWADPWTEVYDTGPGMWAALGEAVTEMHRRAIVLKAHRVDTWLDLPVEVRAEMGRLVLLLDEWTAFVLLRSTTPPAKGERPPETVAQSDAASIAMMGRALGINLVISQQHPIGETMGTYGSSLIANLGARIGVGSLEPSGAGTLFGKSHGEAISTRLRVGVPGRGFFAKLNGADAGHGPVLGDR